MHRVRLLLHVPIAACLLYGGFTACSDNGDSESSRRAAVPTTTAAPTLETTPADAPTDAAVVAAEGDGSCESLDTLHCLLPFPSNHFRTSAAGDSPARVKLPPGQILNTSGFPLDPTDWNRNDGFSPGSPVIFAANGADLAESEFPTQGDIGVSLQQSSGSVVVDMDTGRRLAHWLEADAGTTDPTRQVLVIRVAQSYPEGHRIAVGISGRSAAGDAVGSSAVFRAYRDGLVTSVASVEARRTSMDEVFAALGAAGVDRSALTLAWDFTVASEDSLSERMLAMRDRAFEQLGKAAPAFTVDQVRTDGLPDGIGRIVRGTFSIPSFLTGAGEPGSRLTADDAGLPVQADLPMVVPYSCQLSSRAVADGGARPVVYGHGLLGSHGEVERSQISKNVATTNLMYCATDWIGLSRGDVLNVVTILGDISEFGSLVDRCQQGMLNTLFLARLMKHPDGLSSDPAFQQADGTSAIDTTEAYFDGNSQGGIMGGAVTAVSTEWTKAVLGVPGMNYSLLLSRSVDFTLYFAVLSRAYPDRVDQEIIYGLLQMLWDRAESNGYAAHMTDDPYPGTPAHTVLLHVAFGDHQVAPVAAEIMARTIGARLRAPALASGRHPDAKPFWGLEPAEDGWNGSTLVYWDSGTLPPPSANVTPTTGEPFESACGPLTKAEKDANARCADPHEDPRRQPGATEQKDAFFRPDGEVIDPCDGVPCRSTPSFDLAY